MSDGMLLLWGAWDADYVPPEPTAHDEELWMADPRPLTFEEWWDDRASVVRVIF